MMNLLALSLLLSSLAAAGVWSPKLESKANHHHSRPPRNDQLLREGHRVIVVEYERQGTPDAADPDLPPPAILDPATLDLADEAKHRIHEAASLLPNVGQGASTPSVQPGDAQSMSSAKSMICDAYGVCKEKVSALIGKGKEKTQEKVAEVEDKAEQLRESAKDAVEEKVSKAKESVKEKVSHIKEEAKEAMEKVTEAAKKAGKDLASNESGIAHKAEATAKEVRGNLTDIIRRAREVACDAAAYIRAAETGKAAAGVLHLLGFATAYGACVWVTFVSSNVLAAALPRQQFGIVQSKLYPVYFRLVAYSIAMAFVAHLAGRGRRDLAERAQVYNLVGALAMVLVNLLFFEPKATKVMFERMKVEKEEGRGRDMADVVAEQAGAVASTPGSVAKTTAPTATAKGAGAGAVAVEQDGAKSELMELNGRLRRLNNYSSFLNILALMSLSWHLVHLARRMQVSCGGCEYAG